MPIYVSPAYEKIYRYSIESLFQDPAQFFEVTHPEDRERLATVIRQQRQADHPCEIEYRIIHADGQVRWLWARLSPLIDDKGQRDGLCGVTADITIKKESEIRIREFYSTISHELRAPLTSIRGSLGLICGGVAGSVSIDAEKLIKIAYDETDRLTRLINNFLDIKKIELGHFELNKSLVSPGELISSTAASIKISVLYADANSIRFSVQDSGPGIKPEHISKLFSSSTGKSVDRS